CFPYCSFYCYRTPRALPSFPTRRSSDLRFTPAIPPPFDMMNGRIAATSISIPNAQPGVPAAGVFLAGASKRALPVWPVADPKARSEEHTSELQSRENLVCRLLLEKKKKK